MSAPETVTTTLPLYRRPGAMLTVAAWCWAAALPAGAAEPLAVTRVELSAGGPVHDFTCKPRARRTPPRAPEADPMEMPGDDEVDELLRAPASSPRAEPRLAVLPVVGERLRLAVWGDSHMAAAFFTEELTRLAGLDAALARPSVLPATFGRAGVRLPLRRHCADGEWRYETAHAVPAAVARPGPGLVSMTASRAGASLALDLRTVRGGEAGPLKLLYEGGETPVRLALALDGRDETEITLPARPGPAALEIAGSEPVSQLRLRLIEGTLRLQGLALGPQPRALMQLDVFGYPGATAAGWGRVEPAQMRAWFDTDPYDLVVMAYGTNEGNVNPFDPEAYRQSLASAVANLRAVVPAARCVLIGPGDRGVLVRRSQKARKAKGAPAKPPAVARGGPAAPGPSAALLRYSRVHEAIDGIQKDVADSAGCAYWSALEAMGGAGSAYRWARQGLMAPDLIHFTIRGYQQLAQSFAQAAGWAPATVLPVRAPAR